MEHVVVNLEFYGPKPGGEAEEIEIYRERVVVLDHTTMAAETRALSWVAANFKDPQVRGSSLLQIREVIENPNGGDRNWFVRLEYQVESGSGDKIKIKTVTEAYLTMAEDFVSCVSFLEEWIEDNARDRSIQSIVPSKFVLDVDLYQAPVPGHLPVRALPPTKPKIDGPSFDATDNDGIGFTGAGAGLSGMPDADE